MTEDVRKALKDEMVSGGKYFPIHLENDKLVIGSDRYATLTGEWIKAEGWFESSEPCLASLQVGKGRVFYAGTLLGQGFYKHSDGLADVIRMIANHAEISPTLNIHSRYSTDVHVDAIVDRKKITRALVVQNRSEQTQDISFDGSFHGKGLFSQLEWDGSLRQIILPPKWIDLVILKP
jgi:hypothetical protein